MRLMVTFSDSAPFTVSCIHTSKSVRQDNHHPCQQQATVVIKSLNECTGNIHSDCQGILLHEYLYYSFMLAKRYDSEFLSDSNVNWL